MYEQSIAEYQRAQPLGGDRWDTVAGIGHTQALAGRRAEAEKAILKLQEIAKKDKRALYNIALIYGALGDKDRALESLEKAMDARSVMFRDLRLDPDLDVIKADPRFNALLERRGINPQFLKVS
jgi:Flp pilus assembly protein TadD